MGTCREYASISVIEWTLSWVVSIVSTGFAGYGYSASLKATACLVHDVSSAARLDCQPAFCQTRQIRLLRDISVTSPEGDRKSVV